MKTIKTGGQEIIVKNAPSIDGLKFRSFRGDEDFHLMIDVLNANKTVDEIENSYSFEEMKNIYDHMVRCDIYADMLFAEVNGELVAYGRCLWDEELNGDRLYKFTLIVKPDWRDDRLGNAMIDYFMEHLIKIASEHPAENLKYFQIWAREKESWYRKLIENKAFDAVRYQFMMKRPIGKPVGVTELPEGIELRPIEKENYRKVWEADQEIFRDHWGYVPGTEEHYQGWLKYPHFDPSLWMLAWDGEELVGMVLNFVDKKENEEFKRERGYTEDIGVRREWRRKGIARALLTQSVKMFEDMGMDETVLNVDTENPTGALILYQDVGYKEVKRSMVYRKKME